MKWKTLLSVLSFLAVQVITTHIGAQSAGKNNMEEYRLQFHFSTKANWINDPNGMVYHKGTWHLFFQYHPFSTSWGPMHWGHAISRDLMHWKEEPIALYPDSLGAIFSGSAVVDINNTSGFGKNGKTPLVAIFTHHNSKLESTTNDFQNQSLAYSLDEGMSWTKYAGNPVLHNPGISDFRDPKVCWYEPGKKWIMTLATKDRVTFYSSPDLKKWNKESEFGKDAGAHGGVWECPDLISFDNNGKKIWVLLVNINPGGPNKGSATQYFLGDFDGSSFRSSHTDTRWLDYGPDEYAGITWSNTGNKKIFLGWMSNWLYAGDLPTKTWKGAMTLPRELKLKHVGKDVFITSEVVPQVATIQSTPVVFKNLNVNKSMDFSKRLPNISLPCRINLDMENVVDFSLTIANESGEELLIGYNKSMNQYFIDRTKSGKVDFQKDFASRNVAPRLSDSKKINMSLFIDVSSVELFADDGLTVMSAVFFPGKPYNKIKVESPGKIGIKKMEYFKINSTLEK
ncbi:MAG: glycoside hydrolase family 32 protein [Ferruginibacter sp.]